jgi:hypothetical protein
MTSFITGLIVAILTFPGVIVRQMAKQFLCYYFAIPVFSVRYFQPWPPVGVLQHEPPSSPLTGIMLIIGQAGINTLLGILIGGPAVFSFFATDDPIWLKFLELFFIWLGVSLAVHSFPTFKDAEGVKNSMMADRNPTWIRALGAPLVAVMYLGAVGSIIWLDVIYALLVVVGLPILLLETLRMAF